MWTGLFLDSALKGAFVLALAGIAAIAARRSSAAVRHLIWAVAVALCLAIPVASLFLPSWNVKLPAQVTTALPAAQAPPPGAVELAGTQMPPSVPVKPIDWNRWIYAAWAAGALLVSARIVAGTLQLRNVTMQARQTFDPAIVNLGDDVRSQLGIRRRVTILHSEHVAMPLTYGFSDPVVLLPSAAAAWAPDRIKAVLLHEMGHIMRFDWLTQTFAHAACALYWFNPLVWIAAAQMRKHREHACDDAVLNVGVRNSEYAEHLMFIARTAITRDGVLSASAAMAQPSQLEGRVRAILDTRLSRAAVTRKRALGTVLAAIVLLLPLAGVRSVAQSLNANLSGTVLDASGAAVPNAAVVISNADKNTREVTATSEAGEYDFHAIPPGRYNITVRKQGFALYEKKDVNLKGGDALRANITLDIGQVSETMDIVAKSAMAKPKEVPQRIRVGGNVQATKIVHMVRPAYPESAKAAGIEGPVVMRAVIGKDGGLLSVEVINTLANPDLAKAAKDAVSQWRYEPTLLNGEPVEVVTTITVNYKLDAE